MWHGVHVPKMQPRERIRGDAELPSFLAEHVCTTLQKISLHSAIFVQALCYL